jgi:BRCA1-associated protein
LTCGFVGCGRYSNKHSVAHFEQTRHPYSLELATLRIWDYCHGEYGGFVQRADLLECPSSPPLLYPWLIRGLDSDDQSESISALDRSPYNDLCDSLVHSSTANSTLSKATEKPSKKVMMIGEEYEALLQSALEDQAQHYEDEITRLRAKLTDSLVDRDSMIPEEAKEIEEIQIEIRIVRESIGNTSKELIEAQAQEVELRAVSGRLLSEQKESNELLKTIQEEHRRENEEGKLQIEDLELQISDLKTNLMMRQQISQNNELANAQIFGTTSAPDSRNSGGRKGKKKGRFFRK